MRATQPTVAYRLRAEPFLSCPGELLSSWWHEVNGEGRRGREREKGGEC